jgi:two-component system response regulator DesR
MITIVVAEDQVLVQGALIALLHTERDLRVVGRAADGGEALRVVTAERPDVLLADIEMPVLSGIELAAEVRRRRLPTRVVMLTTFARPGYLTRALDAGACGYLLKDSRPEALAELRSGSRRGRCAITSRRR